MEELSSDKKRQAVPALRGFSYQIWESVRQWLSLDEDSVLILEGAEDIDLLGPVISESIQVKATIEPVTLRSASVQQMIANHWLNREANPDRNVTSRFLTTAKRGKERRNPFGGRRGLDLWDSCKRADAESAKLRSFLSAQDLLPASLRQFSANASEEDLRSQLWTRIIWDTAAQPYPYVEEAVNRMVTAYGDRVFNESVSESEKVVPHLLAFAWKTITKTTDRRLDLSMFRKVFDDAITERRSKSELRRLERASLKLLEIQEQAGFSGALRNDSTAAIGTQSVLGLVRPFVNDRFLLRTNIVSDYRSRLNSVGLLVLAGSTGMGKSTVADQMADRLQGDWRKIDLRGLRPQEIARRLVHASHVIEDQRLQADCIIDDLNFDVQPTVYENALCRLVYSLKSCGGRAILTTQGTLPSRLANLYDVPRSCIVQVPPLSEDEVKQLAINYGCTGDHKTRNWARIIYLITRGHPQLAHARVRSLEARGWPAHKAQDVLAAPDIDAVRREIRTQLRDLVPSDEARLLLYRLSILTHFRKREAISLANHSPQVPLAGEVFDSLTGPWIEQIDQQRFRLSPLLDNAAPEVFAPTEIKELHAIAARSYLQQKTIDITDFNAVLLHGILGEAAEPLSVAVVSINKVPPAQWKDLTRAVDWFSHLSIEAGDRLFPDPLMNVLLRHVQFKIAAEADGPRAVKIAEICMREMESLDDSKLHPDTKRSMQVTFLTNTLFSTQVPFSIETVVAQLTQIISLLRNREPFFQEMPGFDVQREAEMRGVVNPKVLVHATIARCATSEMAFDLLTTLDQQPPADTTEIWETLDGDHYVAMMLLDQIWLKEAQLPEPNWQRSIDRLDRAIEIANCHHSGALLSAAYRAKAVVQEEYLKNKDAALQTVDNGVKHVGPSSVFLEDYRAKILFIEDDFEGALAIWNRVLPLLEEQKQLGRAYSYRDAEICAARLQIWETAAMFAKRGEEAARQPWRSVVDNEVTAQIIAPAVAGFRADHGFALWKLNKHSDAVREFADVLDAFRSLPSPTADLKVNMLYRRVAHGIGWMLQQADGRHDIEEPAPGCFSNPEVIEEVKDQPLEPTVLLWYLLAKLEFRLRLGDSIFKSFEREDGRTDKLTVEVGYRHLKISHALATSRLASLIQDFISYSAQLRTLAKQSCAEHPSWSDSLELLKLLFVALIPLVQARRFHSAPFDQWKKAIAKTAQFDGSVLSWLEYAESIECAETGELLKVVRDRSAALEKRAVAALTTSARSDIDPESRFYANVVLVITDFNTSWRDVIEGTIAELISDGWKNAAVNEKFALKAPNLNTPRIISQCDDNSSFGLKKAAKVLLAARDAVVTTVGGVELEKLRALSQSE